MPMPTLQQIIGTITGKLAFERTQANFTTIKTSHDALEDNLVAHKAESANKHIKESGTNTNGSYIKFDDGTMICTKQEFIVDIFSSNFLTKDWVYPVAFVTPPTTSGMMNDAYYFNGVMAKTQTEVSLEGLQLSNRLPNSSTVCGVRLNSKSLTFFKTGDSMKVDLLAIGRWKV